MAVNDLMHQNALPKKGVVVLDFYKQDCGPCKLMMPTMDGLSEEFAGRAEVIAIDVEQFPMLAAQFGVQAFPTIFVTKDGEIKHFFAGRKPAAVIRKMVEELL